jgi:hypothetical protein
VIPVFFLTVYVLVEHRRYFLRYLAWAAATLIPFLILNLVIYGSLLEIYKFYYYEDGWLVLGVDIFKVLAGNLVSPGRGLLIYSPILLLAPYGIYLKLKNKRMDALDWFLMSIVIAHALLISAVDQWWGGSSYGPRMFSDVMPFLIYFLIPVLARLQHSGVARRKLLATLAACLTFVSFAINLHGAVSKEPFLWNTDPVDVDKDTSRLWDWGDPPFLRGL